ncbi:MAG: hypothetical protein IJY87_03945 [Bacilli bacterium]|nr:hypothetical protein [Bacilli bacterium]MBQ8902203.1 hypothetical protein [Bacilli bacterium]
MKMAFVKLEDNRDCIILDEFTYEKNKYVILVNSLDKDDFIVRKVINEELIGLDNEEEFKKVFMYYYNSRMKAK